jgi:hypothetical protein
MSSMIVAWLPLLLMLIGIGVGLSLLVIWMMAWQLTHPPRMTDGKALWRLNRLSPGDLGLPFETIQFQVRDETGGRLHMAAWWIPHPTANGRCAVLVHGYGDAKVGAIAWAPVWNSLGFNLLVPDLRAHGESEGAACTAGWFERHDLAQMIDQCRAARPHDTQQVVLFGISLGAATAAAAALETRDIAAVVMESPVADFPTSSMRHMDRLGAPGHVFQRCALALAEWLTHADYAAVAPAQLLQRLSCPVMMIQSGSDLFVPDEDQARLTDAFANRPLKHPADRIWVAQSSLHLMALPDDPAAYRRCLEEFLAECSILPPACPAMTPQVERADAL